MHVLTFLYFLWSFTPWLSTHCCLLYNSEFKLSKAFECCAGARLAFGGKELQNHTVPKVYGAIEPTAIFVPLKEILKDEETFKTATTEVFGPLQVSHTASDSVS